MVLHFLHTKHLKLSNKQVLTTSVVNEQRQQCFIGYTYFDFMNDKNNGYESPSVDVIVVQVEQGFQGSGNNDGGFTPPSWGIS